MAKFKADLYFAVDLSKVRPDDTIPFDLYVYLKLNDHIVRLRPASGYFDKQLQERLKSGGYTSIYLQVKDKPILEDYLKPPAKAFKVKEKEAVAIVTKIAAPEPEKKAEGKKQAETLIKNLLATAKEGRKDLMSLVGDPDAEHATTVAIYSTLFMIALGKNDSATLSQVAIAALLHDVGLTQVSPETIAVPELSRSMPATTEYSQHINLGMNLLKEMNYTPPPLAAEIISQHHEKFDGTGYPAHLQGFKIRASSQALAFAELFDSIMRGWYDGVEKNMPEALELIQSIDKETTFPHYFNPDVLHKIIDWLASGGMKAHGEKASALATKTKDNFLKAS